MGAPTDEMVGNGGGGGNNNNNGVLERPRSALVSSEVRWRHVAVDNIHTTLN